jgi:hypothetical protein
LTTLTVTGLAFWRPSSVCSLPQPIACMRCASHPRRMEFVRHDCILDASKPALVQYGGHPRTILPGTDEYFLMTSNIDRPVHSSALPGADKACWPSQTSTVPTYSCA